VPLRVNPEQTLPSGWGVEGLTNRISIIILSLIKSIYFEFLSGYGEIIH
jgi:hypothetical protein